MIQLFVRFYRFSLYLLFIYSFVQLLMPWARLRNHKANYNNPKEVSVCIINQLPHYHTTGPNLPHLLYNYISTGNWRYIWNVHQYSDHSYVNVYDQSTKRADIQSLHFELIQFHSIWNVAIQFGTNANKLVWQITRVIQFYFWFEMKWTNKFRAHSPYYHLSSIDIIFWAYLSLFSWCFFLFCFAIFFIILLVDHYTFYSFHIMPFGKIDSIAFLCTIVFITLLLAEFVEIFQHIFTGFNF